MRAWKTVFISGLLLFLPGCNIEQNDWEKAHKQGTVPAYEEFIRKYPKSDQVAAAQEKITEANEKLAWEKASRQDTSQAYQDFLAKYPSGAHAADAQAKINSANEKSDWEKVSREDSAQAYQDFLNKYPKSSQVTVATEKLRQKLLLEAWPLPPLVFSDWTMADKQTARQLLDRVVESAPSDWLRTTRRITQFRTKRLSFYPGASLCEGLVPAFGATEASIFCFILHRDGNVTLLDGTSPPIHQLNASLPLALNTREQGEAYLRFFCAAIFASGGNFRIVDSVGDALWARDATALNKLSAAKYIRPLAFDRINDGRWKANATVQYGTSLSNALFYLEPDGKVEMAEDIRVGSDLQLRREAFNGYLRYEIGLYK